MKYAVEMGSGGMTYIPSFINTGSPIDKLVGKGSYTDTQAAWESHKPTFIFLNKESKLKN
jgi:hypothetical protein